jgi:gamma-glutamyltranspeptidase/glutathione hydrolase
VPRALPEAADTTHLCTFDTEGNAVSMTHTNGMQSGVITQGRGRITVHDPDALANYVY